MLVSFDGKKCEIVDVSSFGYIWTNKTNKAFYVEKMYEKYYKSVLLIQIIWLSHWSGPIPTCNTNFNECYCTHLIDVVPILFKSNTLI